MRKYVLDQLVTVVIQGLWWIHVVSLESSGDLICSRIPERSRSISSLYEADPLNGLMSLKLPPIVSQTLALLSVKTSVYRLAHTQSYNELCPDNLNPLMINSFVSSFETE